MPPDNPPNSLLYIHGPTLSGRLGCSLDVNAAPTCACTYSCVYCQNEKPDKTRFQRESSYNRQTIMREIITHPALRIVDCITFAGAGEPALSIDLGKLIQETRQLTGKRIAVATNSSLLYRIDVRGELRYADVVIAGLDAGSEEIFHTLNRPHGKIRFDAMMQGLKEFRADFHGQLWLELTLVKDINDTPAALQDLNLRIREVNPDRLDIVLPPESLAEGRVEAPSDEKILEALIALNAVLPERLATQREASITQIKDVEEAILEVAAREPLRNDKAGAIESTFQRTGIVPKLIADGLVKLVRHRRVEYLVPSRAVLGTGHCFSFQP